MKLENLGYTILNLGRRYLNTYFQEKNKLGHRCSHILREQAETRTLALSIITWRTHGGDPCVGVKARAFADPPLEQSFYSIKSARFLLRRSSKLEPALDIADTVLLSSTRIALSAWAISCCDTCVIEGKYSFISRLDGEGGGGAILINFRELPR